MAARGDGRAVVVSIGGSILVPKEYETKPIKRIARVLAECARGKRVLVTVGGGATARDYIQWGRSLAVSEGMLDRLGIQATRINALLLISALQGMGHSADVLRFAPLSVVRAVRESAKSRIVIMGGTTPGHTTDAVAAMLARTAKCRMVVNATSVDGVYTGDPKTDPSARHIRRMTYPELLRLVDVRVWRAGPNVPFDPRGVRILARSGIPLAVVRGTDARNLKSAILGRPFRGTLVT